VLGTIVKFGDVRFDKVCTGRCLDDVSEGLSRREFAANAIYRAISGGILTVSFPVGQMTKKQEVEYLAEKAPSLLEVVHYCRRPVEKVYNCGKCKTCNQMKKSAIEVYKLKELPFGEEELQRPEV
jgi:7-cyano-7-deazaguanine synthase in queuosine biosynthesis